MLSLGEEVFEGKWAKKWFYKIQHNTLPFACDALSFLPFLASDIFCTVDFVRSVSVISSSWSLSSRCTSSTTLVFFFRFATPALTSSFSASLVDSCLFLFLPCSEPAFVGKRGDTALRGSIEWRISKFLRKTAKISNVGYKRWKCINFKL